MGLAQRAGIFAGAATLAASLLSLEFTKMGELIGELLPYILVGVYMRIVAKKESK